MNWRRQDFDFDLPQELIAQYPTAQRSASRLLHLGGNGVRDRVIRELPQLLQANDLLIFNDTRVINARIHGRKFSGGKVELLVERILSARRCLAQLGVSRSPKAGDSIRLSNGELVEVCGRREDLFELQLERADADWWSLLERDGELPLPPYIEHSANQQDQQRYQTVFAKNPGAVAAPTAGLHFDDTLLEAIQQRGTTVAQLTLHVGAGTFKPVRVDNLQEHRMHAERYQVSSELVERIAQTRNAGGRVCAVGTTVTRALESAANGAGEIATGPGESELFIVPGYQFKVVDLLLTNFHLPESTLMMLVSAFGGYQRMRRAYEYAIEKRYRFFSYGDAMLIEPALRR